MLQVENLVKHFSVSQTAWQVLLRRPPQLVRAVDGVSFSLAKGETLAVVGESGCGKTTIARSLIGLEEPTSGTIKLEGEEVKPSNLKSLRQRAQMIFQDPYESLNPRATILDIVSEPLVVHGLTKKREERLARVKTALEEAGLRPAEDYFLRYPHELSGGQRQRVVIAGAMVLQPQLLIADEPLSMLDVSIRAEILNLLRDLQKKRGVSILFITHDLSTVAYFADRIAVMYLGRIVESGKTAEVLQNPQHPYTQALLSVIPVPNPRQRRERLILQGETPNPLHLPSGCRFHPRCPAAQALCAQTDPPAQTLSPTHTAACFFTRAPKKMDTQLYLERLFEAENLTDNLEDAPAKRLLEWASQQLENRLRHETDEEQAHRAVTALARLLRAINRLYASCPQSVTPQALARLQEACQAALSHTPNLAALPENLPENPQEHLSLLLAWLQPQP
jgi:oligopeptide/dipeptide ABC transporter ATP-binding protein